MKLCLDRFEGEYCVFVNDDGIPFDYLKSDMKSELKIGDIVEGTIENGNLVYYTLLEGEGEKIAQKNKSLMERLRNRNKNDGGVK